MRHLLIRLATALAGATVLVAPAAASATVNLDVAGFGPAHHALAGHGVGYNINGYNWGGYAATGSGFTSVSATWTTPSATCNSRSDLYAPWVGLDGYGSSTVEQTGVATDCSSGRAVNEPWYEMYPAAPVYLSTSSYPVAAGNVIHASVTYGGGSSYTLSLTNQSRGWTYTTTKSLSSARRSSAEVIIESPPGRYPNFGTISFTGSTVNGSSLSSFNPVAMDPSNGVYEAHTSALSGGNFSIAYQHE
ncbi:MAG TPA: G1 family glutamic endopeptidase [Rugosimonospora sp.]|jgi:hypothetical protein